LPFDSAHDPLEAPEVLEGSKIEGLAAAFIDALIGVSETLKSCQSC